MAWFAFNCTVAGVRPAFLCLITMRVILPEARSNVALLIKAWKIKNFKSRDTLSAGYCLGCEIKRAHVHKCTRKNLQKPTSVCTLYMLLKLLNKGNRNIHRTGGEIIFLWLTAQQLRMMIQQYKYVFRLFLKWYNICFTLNILENSTCMSDCALQPNGGFIFLLQTETHSSLIKL